MRSWPQKRSAHLAWVIGQSNKFTHHWFHYECIRLHIIIDSCCRKGFTNLSKQRFYILNLIGFCASEKRFFGSASRALRLDDCAMRWNSFGMWSSRKFEASPGGNLASTHVDFGNFLMKKKAIDFNFIVHRVEYGAARRNVQNKQTHHPENSHIFRVDLRDIRAWEFEPWAVKPNVPRDWTYRNSAIYI